VKKTFISVIPFQGKDREGNDQLKPVLYKPSGNTRLVYGETRFPIIPVINGYADAGDEIRIISVLTEGENFKHNYETYFKPEVSALVKNKGLSFDEIEVIHTPDSEGIDAQLQLFGDIISKIGDDEKIFACITYGTKPTPIVETLALNYAYKLKKNVSVGCIVYGRFMHGQPNGTIYDTTALFYMDSIVNKLADMKVKAPEAVIKAMIAAGDKDE
jgi:hypothetical protein